MENKCTYMVTNTFLFNSVTFGTVKICRIFEICAEKEDFYSV